MRDSVSNNHPPHDYLLNRLFSRRSKKTSKLRFTGLCAGNSPGTSEFPAQMASNAKNVSIQWRHHGEITHLHQKLNNKCNLPIKQIIFVISIWLDTYEHKQSIESITVYIFVYIVPIPTSRYEIGKLCLNKTMLIHHANVVSLGGTLSSIELVWNLRMYTHDTTKRSMRPSCKARKYGTYDQCKNIKICILHVYIPVSY